MVGGEAVAEPLRVLVLEDDPDDAALAIRALEREGYSVEWRRVDTAEGLTRAIEKPPDVILADYNLPGFDVHEALRTVRDRRVAAPFIVVSGTIGEEAAVAIMREGAADYLLKDRLSRLGPAVRRAVSAARDHAEMRRVEDLCRRIVETTQEGIWIIDAEARTFFANDRMATMLGYASDDVLGHSLLDFVDGAAHADALSAIMRLRGGMPAQHELRFTRADGSDLWALLSTNPLLGADGEYQGALAMVTDITARHRASENRRALLNRLVQASEEERQSLAEDLHDGPVQQFVAIGLRLSALAARQPTVESREKVEALRSTLVSGIEGLRRIMFELQPPSLENQTLLQALHGWTDLMMGGDGVAVELDAELSREPDLATREVAYRIAREALANVRKHSGASRAEVRVSDAGGELRISVRDDGIGFDLGEPGTPGHYGLRHMRERAEAAGGRCTVTSTPGQGTTVEVRLPLATAESDAADFRQPPSRW